MDNMINVGASKDAVAELTKAVKMVLDAAVCDSVQLAALEVLREGLAVKNTTIQNCSFTTSKA